MLVVSEYVEQHDLYIVVPVLDGHLSPDMEYVFASEEDQLEFINSYMRNPSTTHFAYEARMRAQAFEERHQALFGGVL